MKWRTAKDAVAWAYEYQDIARSPRSITPDPDYIPATGSIRGFNHHGRVLATRILDHVGGYIPPDRAHDSTLAYYLGWISWSSLHERERKRVRRDGKRLTRWLRDQGLLPRRH